MKEKILKEIEQSLLTPRKGANSMGCGERYYDENYMIGSCFTREELEKMEESTLLNLKKLAGFASEIFY